MGGRWRKTPCSLPLAPCGGVRSPVPLLPFADATALAGHSLPFTAIVVPPYYCLPYGLVDVG